MSMGALPIASAPVSGFALSQLLGRGRKSCVYLARDERHGRTVALKLAPRKSAGDAASRFAHEHAVAGTLSHPNVMRVFEHGVSADFAFLSMEHAQAGTLRDVMAAPVAPAVALPLLMQAATALAQLHRISLVHRDVKPANLLFRASGQLVLGDFGCVCRRGEVGATPPGTVVGTPRYASPEQSQGASAHPAADVYSLGVILYELLSGRPLFPGQTLTELASQHAMAAVPRLASHCIELQPLVDAMLAKDAGCRPGDASEVLEQLRPLQARFHVPGAGDPNEGRLT
jgi:serine/threonine protein kinase